jgi:hypothetical protein
VSGGINAVARGEELSKRWGKQKRGFLKLRVTCQMDVAVAELIRLQLLMLPLLMRSMLWRRWDLAGKPAWTAARRGGMGGVGARREGAGMGRGQIGGTAETSRRGGTGAAVLKSGREGGAENDGGEGVKRGRLGAAARTADVAGAGVGAEAEVTLRGSGAGAGKKIVAGVGTGLNGVTEGTEAGARAQTDGKIGAVAGARTGAGIENETARGAGVAAVAEAETGSGAGAGSMQAARLPLPIASMQLKVLPILMKIV